MAPRRTEVKLPIDERLVEGEERTSGVAWPLAVDQWLEQCLEQADRAGLSTSRKELAAALMTAHEYSDDGLSDLLRNYRRRTVGDLLSVETGDNVVRFHRQGPGPRSRRAPGR